mmetsp:Transcript_1424/g.1707  ORF Transcript_1424/g.1707 Transcript_1424/m.1707 type:complete len:80 (+) Transcript_1424:198-437(+)
MKLINLGRTALSASRSRATLQTRSFGTTPAPGSRQVPFLPEVAAATVLATIAGGAWMGFAYGQYSILDSWNAKLKASKE